MSDANAEVLDLKILTPKVSDLKIIDLEVLDLKILGMEVSDLNILDLEVLDLVIHSISNGGDECRAFTTPVFGKHQVKRINR